MRFHLLANPNVQTTQAYELDGFCTATIRFAKLLKGLGHEVLLYASEENEAPCDDLITTITKKEQEGILKGSPYQYATYSASTALWTLSNASMIREIEKRKRPNDFICSIGGTSQIPVAEAHPDMMFVEYSVGYISSFSKYRVFESRVWQHCTHGYQDNIRGSFLEDVIPLFFDETKFKHNLPKEGFALYAGRLTEKKGIELACKAAKLAGIPLKVIGHGDTNLITDGAEYLGSVSDAERNDWMARASVFICPTLYIEPFGSVAVEAQMSGCPVVSTPFGGFVETVEQGKTGYRCHYMDEFVRALHEAQNLDPKYIRDRAVSLYSMGAAAPQYQRYFERLLLLDGKEFYGLEVYDNPRELMQDAAE
jgi:glycosyltransferase involved in cell wall biosynthesis